MPLQPIGAWAPDALGIISDASAEQNVAGEALGVLPGPTGYRPWPAPATSSLAVASAVRGAFACRLLNNNIGIFVGTGTKLYKFAGTTTAWTDVSRLAGGAYNLAADDCWQFFQFGANLIAINGSDAPQFIDVNVGTNFAVLVGSPPMARFGVATGDIVMLANTSVSGLQVDWSGRNNASFWTNGTQDSDQQTFGDGGYIQGITGIEQGGLILQTDTVRQYFARSDRAIFEFHRAEAAQGTRSPYSIIPYQGGAFYYGNRGFAAVGLAGTSTPIGDGYINEWFLANSSVKTRPKAVIGALDPVKARMFWLFAGVGNGTSSTYDQILCFDPALVGTSHGPWTHANVQASYLFAAATTATSLDNLGSAGLNYTFETLPYTLDSDVWKGGAPALGMFDAGNKLNFFSGTPLAAKVDTAIFAPVPGRRSFIRGWRPLCDVYTIPNQSSSNITGRVGTAERAEDFIVWQGAQPLTPQGLIPCRAAGRFLRVEMNIPAGQVWQHLAGIDDVDVIEDGER